MLTLNEISQMKAIEAKARREPWEFYCTLAVIGVRHGVTGAKSHTVCMRGSGTSMGAFTREQVEHDMRFIAAAREFIPKAITELERLKCLTGGRERMLTEGMTTTALAPWFGSKRTLAPRIVEALGEHSAYWEPFCGSMSVLLAKPPCAMETVNDLHGDLINLARVVRCPSAGPRLYRRLRRVMMAKPLHTEAANIVKDEPLAVDAIDRAEAYFVASWMGRNGVSGSRGYNFGYCVRYTKNGGHAAKRFAGAVDSIPAWRRRIRQVNILSEDAFVLIDKIEDAKGVAIYADPPYLEKGAKYVHDFDSWDHYRLAKALRRFQKTRVVVSYYDHPRLAELYPGWHKEQIEVTKAMASQGKRDESNDIRAVEVLLVNHPSPSHERSGA